MNLLRITATAYVYCTLGAVAAHAFFHDLAGWLMMPLAFAALWLELALLGRLFVTVPVAAGPVPLTLPRKNPPPKTTAADGRTYDSGRLAPRVGFPTGSRSESATLKPVSDHG